MAGEDRTAAHALALFQALAEKPYRFGFRQAMRLLECEFPDKERLGNALRPGDEPVRLGQEASLAFAPAELASFRFGADGAAPRLEGYFFGLFGPNGPLPLHLTQYVRDRERNSDDATLARFVDIFHHRLLCLFYRAWANAQPTVSHDRPHDDPFASYVGSLIGIGSDALRSRDALSDTTRLHWAGRLALQSRPAAGLRDMLDEYFEVPVRLHQFVGEWLSLPDDGRWRLGQPCDIGRLGATSTIGASVWGCQYKFRIQLGPMSYADFQRFLPGSATLERLVAAVRFYAGDTLNWDLNLILRRDEVPALQLGVQGQIGRTAWIIQDKRQHDAADALLEPLRQSDVMAASQMSRRQDELADAREAVA